MFWRWGGDEGNVGDAHLGDGGWWWLGVELCGYMILTEEDSLIDNVFEQGMLAVKREAKQRLVSGQ